MEYTTAGTPGNRGNTFSQSSASSPGLDGQLQHGSPTTDASPPPAKRRRTRTDGPNGNGCLHCRARKVKCPGRPENGGACKACLKFSFDCNFAKGEDGPAKVVRVPPSIHRTEAGTPRARAPKACNECHAHKTRCTSEHPQCRRCKSMNIECVYEKIQRKSAAASGSRPSAMPNRVVASSQSLVTSSEQPLKAQQSIESSHLASPSASLSSHTHTNRHLSLGHNLLVEDIIARKNIVTGHFRMWFKVCARMPFLNFLHERSTYVDIEQNRLNQNVGKIVCAITTRYLNPGLRQLPSFAEMCAEDVEKSISQRMDAFLKEPGRENLIVLLITICHFWTELDMGKVWMLMGLSGRMITALQLNWDGAGETPFEQESIRRAVWGIWSLDRRLAGGFEEHLILRDEFMHLSRPLHDADILENDTAVTSHTSGSQPGAPVNRPHERPPLSVFHIDLCRLKHHVLLVTKKMATSPTPHPRPRVDPSKVLESVEQLQCRLFQFHQSLPECLKVSDPVIGRWALSPDCGSLVMMYTLFCELHIDLYRFSIPGLREEADPEIARQLPRDFVEHSQNQAVGYAVSLSRFWQSMQEHVSRRSPDDGTEKLLSYDSILILSIVQSTKVLLAARKHRLFAHLGESSSAPLVRESPVTDDCLAALIQSNMGLFEAYSYFFPRTVEIYTQDLRAAVQNFQRGIPYDNPRQTIGMPARKPPHNVRLPGPHYMLEQAIAPPDEEYRATHRNKSGADILFRQKKQASYDTSAPSGGLSSLEEVANPEKPDIPVWLATARARDALATVSSTSTTSQESPQTPYSPYQSHHGQYQLGTLAAPQPSPSVPSFSFQPQYGQHNPMPMITDSAPRIPLSPYAQQHSGQHPHSVPTNTRQQLLSTLVRSSSWRPEGRPPSGQSSPLTPAKVTQLPLPAQTFQHPKQLFAQPMQQQPPSSSTPPELPPQAPSADASYPIQVPERSSLEEQHSPVSQAIVNGPLSPNYWANQPPTPFEIPEMAPIPPTGRPPSISLVYDRARGAQASATPPQLPFPVAGQYRTLLANVTPGYYVRAAGTLQNYPGISSTTLYQADNASFAALIPNTPGSRRADLLSLDLMAWFKTEV